MNSMRISQDAFDSVVKENMDDFGMELDEALEDAIKTFQMQGVDLKGVITDGSGSASIASHPVVKAIKELQDATSSVETPTGRESCILPLESVSRALQELFKLCKDGESASVSLAGRYGGVEAVIFACKSPGRKGIEIKILALKVLNLLIGDAENRDKYRCVGGPEMVMSIIIDKDEDPHVKMHACTNVSSSAMGDELVKEKFMDSGITEVLAKLLKEHASDEGLVLAICHAFRSLVVADDDRVIASKAFINARTFAENGMVEAILGTCKVQRSSLAMAGLCMALTSLAVNEVICKSIAEQQGISFVLQVLDDSTKHKDKVVVKSACSLLSQLAGSDGNKDAIVIGGGIEKIICTMSMNLDDPSVLQETFTVIAVLTLRFPDKAEKAVKSGVLDMVTEAMENHPSAVIMQRQACQMLRNLAARSPENRSAILNKGLEILIRHAKTNHASCRDAASAALRDLGFDDYNS